jgi:tRNA(Ile)-lysidine synthase
VLPPRDGDRIRPFFQARRVDIDAHVARHRLPHVHDPSNADTRFLRNLVRRDLLPSLEAVSPRVVEHLCRIADDAGRLQGSASPVDPQEMW